MSTIEAILRDVTGEHEVRLRDRDFLLTWDHSEAEIRAVVALARRLEQAYRAGKDLRCFRGELAVSIFRDQSTRTRFSYATAAGLLGLTVQELDEKKSQIAHGETVRETATMISFATQTIGVRDDLYLGHGHSYMKQVAEALDESCRAGVLPQRPAVINLQCDLDHPTQTLADLMHLIDHFGSLEALRGRRLAMSWAYSPSYGKPLSVPQGIVALLTRFGMDVVLAHPPGYELVDEVLEQARRFAEQSGGRFTQTQAMDEAFRDADVVYPKSWAPLHIMQQRSRMLERGDTSGYADLEREALEHNARYRDWECNERLMRLTRGGEALYMHCLPADISGVSCEAGEVSEGVFEKYRLQTYREASHKPFVIAAMMALARMTHDK